jgi:AP endonuclease-2
VLTIRTGYSGVAIYTRNAKCHPIKAEEGITGILEPPFHPGCTYKTLPAAENIGGYPELSEEDATLLDSEGRALILDFNAFVLIGAYCPVATDPSRDNFRISFVRALCSRVRNLVIKCQRRVVVAGDLNIARDMIDMVGAEQVMKGSAMERWKDTPTRRALDELLEPHIDGIMVDLCREYFPERTGMYTCSPA